eukprot:1089990-Pleurochrysis_carterae.AAC.1
MRRLLFVLLLRLVVHVQASRGLPTLYARSDACRPDNSSAFSSLLLEIAQWPSVPQLLQQHSPLQLRYGTWKAA